MSKSIPSASVSGSSNSTGSGDGDWLDVEPDEETVTVVSLLDSETFPSLELMLAHCRQNHGFDLVATVRRLKLDFHGAVKLVNFIRRRVQDGQSLPAEISPADFEDDAYLKPILDNDAVVFSLDEVLEAAGETGDSAAEQAAMARNKELEAELESVRSQFANYRLAVQETLDRRWGDDAQPESSAGASAAPDKKDNSDYYFESYAFNEIHETMLKDAIRTDAYRDFIYNNKHIFQGKVVLDIGCGTGILSMFCAKAGAAQVIAVDKSDILTKAMENIFNNGLSDKITCVKGAIEDVVLPVEKVDIIVSEWMGYCLLYEAMLPSVLYARDKYLKPDGLIAPSSVSLWIAPVADPEFVSDHISYWRDVYGFDMKAMQEAIYDEVRIEHLPEDTVCGEPSPFKTLDLYTVRAEDLSFTATWDSKITRNIDALDGFVIWFDNFFANSRDDPIPEANATPKQWVQRKQGNVGFTTGPFGTITHWKQGLLLAPSQGETTDVAESTKLSGKVTFSVLEENVRALEINTSWTVGDHSETSRSWKLK